MLTSQAFYALHGPPGTGKTTVAAHAVEAYLAAERGARVLVSAQSNYALDNLALRIRKRIRDRGLNDILAIRVSSQTGEEKIHPSLTDWTLGRLSLRRVKEIMTHCARNLERRRHSDPILSIIGRWKAAVETSHLELHDRLRRGANLVFATCASATRRNVDAVGSFGVYDWVLVEEAAKAWPTELAIPLTRGVRWTLIGDHRQLPAHRRQEVDDMLNACRNSDDEDLKSHYESRDDHRRVFDLFGSLFADRNSRKTGTLITTPVGRLTHQYRMREPIANVVSGAFYGDTLTTDTETNLDSELRAPKLLQAQSLVWLDTYDVTDCTDQPRWAKPRRSAHRCQTIANDEAFTTRGEHHFRRAARDPHSISRSDRHSSSRSSRSFAHFLRASVPRQGG